MEWLPPASAVPRSPPPRSSSPVLPMATAGTRRGACEGLSRCPARRGPSPFPPPPPPWRLRVAPSLQLGRPTLGRRRVLVVPGLATQGLSGRDAAASPPPLSPLLPHAPCGTLAPRRTGAAVVALVPSATDAPRCGSSRLTSLGPGGSRALEPASLPLGLRFPPSAVSPPTGVVVCAARRVRARSPLTPTCRCTRAGHCRPFPPCLSAPRPVPSGGGVLPNGHMLPWSGSVRQRCPYR